MADLTIICAACGNRITISEFVSAESVVCMQCKASVPVPPRAPPVPAAAGLKLATAPVPGPATPPPEPTKRFSFRRKKPSARPSSGPTPLHISDVRQFLPSATHKVRRRSSRPAHKIWPWLLFILLSFVLCWVRFWPGAVSALQLPTVILVGVWALVGLHIVVVIYAFDDDPFHGVLCTIVPGYSLYYLFGHADQFYVRSLALALLLAFGWDAYLAGQQVWQSFYHGTTAWIEGKDTFKKDLPH